MRSLLGRLLAVSMLVFVTACSSVSYYTQAVVGQLSILSKRKSLDRLIADEATHETLRNRLHFIQSVLAFADENGLPVNGAYSAYVDTGRAYVVWNVFAAPTFSTELKRFCYPMVGCLAYKGFFAEQAARDYARSLADEGMDVYVGGVAAYSTRGWFDDPVLNTFIARSDERLAALLFHELAHRVVFVKGDTQFNESFATTVERTLLRQWLTERGQPSVFDAYLEDEAKRQETIALITKARSALAEIYASDEKASVRRKSKHERLQQLQNEYAELEQTWGAQGPYAGWMAQPINNAQLGTVAIYHELVPQFEALLATSGNLRAFLEEVKVLAKQPNEVREQRLMAEAESF